MLGEAWNQIVAPGAPTPGRVALVLGATEAAAIAGLREESRSLLDVLDRLAPRCTRLWDGALPARISGMAASVAGDWGAAEEFFESSIRVLSGQPNVLEAPQIEHWYGKMLLDRGHPDDQSRAAHLIGSALGSYEQLGMPVHAAMAREIHRVAV
jgi:hypothetical protein